MRLYRRAAKEQPNAPGLNSRRQLLRLHTATLAMMISVAACGGRVSPVPETKTETDAGKQTGNSGSDPSQAASTGNGPTESPDDLDAQLPLGECPEGWQAGSAECPWLASDDLCYATKTDACACICPRRNDTSCLSGLPGGSDSRTWVSCD
jgi:hypothetical protein